MYLSMGSCAYQHNTRKSCARNLCLRPDRQGAYGTETKVLSCLNAAALSTGCSVFYEPLPFFRLVISFPFL